MYRLGIWGWIAIAVVAILVFIWITHSAYTRGYMPDGVFKDTYESMIASANKTYDRWVESPTNLYVRSVGYEYDDSVKLAIEKATKLEDMHHRNITRMGASAADAATNSFILAELNRYNVAPNVDPNDQLDALDRANVMYRRTLYRIRNNPIDVVEQGLQAETMLDHIENFDLTENDIDIQNIIAETRQGVRAARVEVARTKPAGRRKLTGRAAYYDARDLRNDPQNVHDTQLAHDLRVKFNNIVNHNQADQQDVGARNFRPPIIDDIRVELNRANLQEDKHERAMQILNTMSVGNPISSLNTTEDKVLLEVWKRINSPENATNRDDLKRSLWDSMASGVETNYNGDASAVCITGRCSRVLDSLTLMDADNKIAKPPQTVDSLRNEVLAKSYTILQNMLRDSDLSNVYNGNAPETDENRQSLIDFKASIKRQMEDTIRTDYPDAKPETLSTLIQDAQAGVEI
jgi:hypothetical protein